MKSFIIKAPAKGNFVNNANVNIQVQVTNKITSNGLEWGVGNS